VARRPRAVEVRTAWLLPLFVLNPSDENTFQEAIAEHDMDRRLLEAHVVLGNDCPRKRRPNRGRDRSGDTSVGSVVDRCR